MRFPWRWTLPALVVIAATVVHGVIRYPQLPDRLPIHYRLDGSADRWVTTTALSAFAPVLIQLVLTLALAGGALLALRSRPAAPAAPRAVTCGVLFLAACEDLAIYLLATQMWRGGDLRGFAGTAAALCFVAGLTGLVVTVAYARRKAPAGPPVSPPAGENRHWRAGMFYVNRDDPALLVHRRSGLGWTLNLGQPRGQVILAIMLALPLISVLASLL